MAAASPGGRICAAPMARRQSGLGTAPLWTSPPTESGWCVGFRRELRLVPVGAGEPRTLRRGMIDSYRQALFLPDSKRLVILGSVGGRPKRLFVQELPNGEPRPFTPEGVSIAMTTSPDGRLVAAQAIGADRFVLYPVDGGEPQPIQGLANGDLPLRFSTGGAGLFVSEGPAGTRSGRGIVRLDLATGRKSPWLGLRPADPASLGPRARMGVIGKGIERSIDITPDGRSYLYSYSRVVSDLYIVDGLR